LKTKTMKKRTLPTVPLVLLLLGPLAAAQGTKKTEPASAPAKPAATAPAKPVTSTAEPKTRLELHVKGLTSENLDKVRGGLSALTYSAYTCDHCQFQASEPGKCPKCSAELKPEKRPMFSSVMPTPGDSTITLVLAPNHVTRLSEIERALRVDSVSVDEAALPIAGQAELVLRGGKAESLSAVEKALQDAKLFDELHARWDPGHDEIRVTARAGATPPTRGRVESAIGALKLEIKDVVWGNASMKS